MAEPAQVEAPEKDLWEMADDEILGEADLDEPAPDLEMDKEYPGDVARQMATAEDAEELIEKGLEGARRIYKDHGEDILTWSTGSGVDQYFAIALMGVETGGRKSIIYGPTVSDAGAAGIGQFMPDTWAMGSRKVYGREMPPEKRFDPKIAGPVVFYYLNRLDYLGFHKPYEVAAAYNAGRGRVRQFREGKIKNLPKETQRYMTAVLSVAHLIEREIMSETVPETQTETESPASDTMNEPKSDDQILNEAMKGG
jgi:soluble lytic murein transglycosylase-like protein